MVCNTQIMRDAFRQLQISFGRKIRKELTTLDVENSWNSIFIKINACFQLEEVFEALSNKFGFTGEPDCLKILD